jgi:copper chaperone
MSTENKTLKFKTNLKCGGCLAAVTPHLNAMEGISSWSVDTLVPDKILTVESTGATAGQIIEKLQLAGYHGEILNG